MTMSRRKPKHPSSLHALARLGERGYGGAQDGAPTRAWRYGLRVDDVERADPESPLASFLYQKEWGAGKRVVAYDGFVWVMSRNSGKLITAYPIPDGLMAEYAKVRPIEDEKRRKWKEWKAEKRSGAGPKGSPSNGSGPMGGGPI